MQAASQAAQPPSAPSSGVLPHHSIHQVHVGGSFCNVSVFSVTMSSMLRVCFASFPVNSPRKEEPGERGLKLDYVLMCESEQAEKLKEPQCVLLKMPYYPWDGEDALLTLESSSEQRVCTCPACSCALCIASRREEG